MAQLTTIQLKRFSSSEVKGKGNYSEIKCTFAADALFDGVTSRLNV